MSDEWRYFKTRLPKNILIIQATGKSVPITEISPDLGVVMAKNDNVIKAIDDQIANGRGGWESITNVEYDQIVAQKKSNSPKQWREEWPPKHRLHQDTFGKRKGVSVAAARAMESAPEVPPAARSQEAPDPTVAPEQPYRPTSTKRPQ